MKLIILDPGHGGFQSGAVQGTIQEKDLNLKYALEIGTLLRQKGFTVLYTRDRDNAFSLSDRLNMIQTSNPDAFISIHCNATDDINVKGSEIYYRDEKSFSLAQEIQRGLMKSEIGCRGIYEDVEHLGKHLTVLNDMQIPSVLVELGYMTNPSDESKLIDDLIGLSELLASSITAYFS